MDLFYSPYVCANPAGHCPIPELKGITTFNRVIGCVHLDPSRECVPGGCPAFRCGDTCPKPCPADKTDAECLAMWKQQAPQSDCVDAYMRHFARAIARNPVPGCSGPCCGVKDEHGNPASGCCTEEWGDQGPACWGLAEGGEPADLPYDMSDEQPFKFPAAGPGPLYANYFNVLANCLRGTCFCPLGLGSVSETEDAFHVGCSGHGTCTFSGVSGADRADPDQYFCTCDSGYGGVACSATTQQPTPGSCPKGWSHAKNDLLECSGLAHGTCDAGKGVCDCMPGWTGPACDVLGCPVTDDGQVCGGNGKCSWNRTCLCAEGYSGAACQCHMVSGKRVCPKRVATPGESTQGDGIMSVSSVTDSIGASTVQGQVRAKARSKLLVAGVFAVLIAIFLYVVLFPPKKAPAHAVGGAGDAALTALLGSPPPAC